MTRWLGLEEEPADPSVGAGAGVWTGEGVTAVGVGAGEVGGGRHSSNGTMLMGLLVPGSVNDARGETEHKMLATP